jgi:hypothetical protein
MAPTPLSPTRVHDFNQQDEQDSPPPAAPKGTRGGDGEDGDGEAANQLATLQRMNKETEVRCVLFSERACVRVFSEGRVDFRRRPQISFFEN